MATSSSTKKNMSTSSPRGGGGTPTSSSPRNKNNDSSPTWRKKSKTKDDEPEKQDIPKHMADIRDSCFKFLEKEAESYKRWELLQESNDLETTLEIARYKGRPNDDIITTRGRLRFPNTEPEEVLDLILNLHKRPEWDSQMSAGKVHVEYNHCNADIAYLAYNGALMVLPRDLCILRAWDIEPKERCVLVAQSVVDDSIPENNGFVRAELKECGYLMKRVRDMGYLCTEVTYISSTDMKGNIPITFTNIILRQQPGTLLAMRDLLKKRRKEKKNPNAKGESGSSCAQQ